jgi:hypothetical protein
MSTKAKATSTSNNNIKPNTRALTSIIKESKLNKLILIIEDMRSNIININNRLNTIKYRLNSLKNASI